MLRLPAVAGQFYPGSKKDLTEELSDLIPKVPPSDRTDALAVISPHAGYIYSGAVAGATYSEVNIPDDVIILGPNHHGYGSQIALMSHGTWETPLGQISINDKLAAIILKRSELIESDVTAHEQEHSLEVQVPFLQYFNPELQIIPICVSRIGLEDCLSIGKDLAGAIKDYGKRVLIIASTDMTHYESRSSASRKDRFALDSITDLNPERLYDTVLRMKISMCGIIPTTITLAAAKALGATTAKLVRYTDSGETSGNTDRVVAYAGFVIH